MDEIRSTISPEMKQQMEMSVAIANRIYEILEIKGMTQKDLAQRLGKTETEVSRWREHITLRFQQSARYPRHWARILSPYPRGSWSRRCKWPDVFYVGLCGESQYSGFLALFMGFLC
jgi:hypothetical protein